MMKSNVCYTFQNTGNCSRGESCRYTHDDGNASSYRTNPYQANAKDQYQANNHYVRQQPPARNSRSRSRSPPARTSRSRRSSSSDRSKSPATRDNRRRSPSPSPPRREAYRSDVRSDYRDTNGDGRSNNRDPFLQICYDFNSGKGCSRGSSCRYAHSDGSGGRDSGREERGGGGSGRGGGGYRDREDREDSRAPYTYDSSRPPSTGVCYAFQKGECNRGSSCRYSHDGRPNDSSRDMRANTSNFQCYAFARGECTRGDTCRFQH